MNGDKKNMIYTATDIEAYLSGKLSPSQMHAMEKDALDDPFLAEAMEGYEGMKGKPWNTQLTALHQHFGEDRSMAKIIPLNRSTGRWWKAAAAVLVIGSGAVLTYLLTKEKAVTPDREQIAQTSPVYKDSVASNSITTTTTIPAVHPLQEIPENKKPKTESAEKNLSHTDETGPVKPITKSDADLVLQPDKLKQPEDRVISKGIVSAEEKDKNSGNATTANTVPSAYNNAANGKEINIAKNNEPNQSVVNAADENKKRALQNTAPFGKTMPVNRNFFAQVVGPDNSPLPFANINIKSEKFGTYADVKGYFRLVSQDTLLNVEVRSVGYLPRVYTLHSNLAQNKIVLAEDENTAKEKTVFKANDNEVAANRSLRKAIFLKDSSLLDVEPADGWANYNTYIANNIDIPDDILKNDLHGEVDISFDVKSNGVISNIKIDQSDCSDCAELAKRLIEHGPQWKVKKGKNATARIKVQF